MLSSPVNSKTSLANRNYRLRCTTTTFPIPPSEIEDVMNLIALTKQGAGKEIKKKLDDLIISFGNRYRSAKEVVPVADPNIVGNYDVSYVGTLSSTERGNPAGGIFRSAFGEFIISNLKPYQHILSPNKNSNNNIRIINYISGTIFRIFGFHLILKGYIVPLSKEELNTRNHNLNKNNITLSESTVRAYFEPAYLALTRLRSSQDSLSSSSNPLLALRLGSNSTVVLDTPYVDEHIRTGRGSRGSIFLFTRTNTSESNGYIPILSYPSTSAVKVGLKLFVFGSSMLLLSLNNIFAMVDFTSIIFPIWNRIKEITLINNISDFFSKVLIANMLKHLNLIPWKFILWLVWIPTTLIMKFFPIFVGLLITLFGSLLIILHISV